MTQSKNILRGDIWLTKTSYESRGEIVEIEQSLMIWAIDHPFSHGAEHFVNAYLVSPSVQYASRSDLVCNDASIIGYPFLVETWNEQPVAAALLDRKLGTFHAVVPDEDEDHLTEEQQTFRKEEIRNARFLQQYVFTRLQEQEGEESSTLSFTTWMKVAAALLVVALSSYYLIFEYQSEPQPLIFEGGIFIPLDMILPDSSTRQIQFQFKSQSPINTPSYTFFNDTLVIWHYKTDGTFRMVQVNDSLFTLFLDLTEYRIERAREKSVLRSHQLLEKTKAPQ